jgi:transcriptional regulator with XRE-family HTH domain
MTGDFKEMVEVSRSIGEQIRERRLAAGMSLGQLASKVHLTAAAVRSWERGESFPDASIHGALAEVLDLDVGLLDPSSTQADAQPVDPVSDFDSVDAAAHVVARIESEVAEAPARQLHPEAPSAAESPAMASEHASPVSVPVAAAPAESMASQGVDTGVVEAPTDADPETGIDSNATSPNVGPDLDAVRHDLDAMFPSNGTGPMEPVPVAVGAQGFDQSLLDAPTMQVASAQLAPTTMPAARPRVQDPARPMMTVAPVSYIEDTAERWRYWLRTALLAVVLVTLLVVALWALGELRDAVADVWNGINVGETPDVDLG